MSVSEVHNMDCMEYMAQFPDKHFDLAVVDPPYGINAADVGVGNSQKRRQKNKTIKGGEWDKIPADAKYFKELFRVSKNQIICGGNYFDLPPTRGIICWDKGLCMRGRDFSEWEYLWTSYDKVARLFYFDLNKGQGFIRTNQSRISKKIHPTQKPVELYSYLFSKHVKAGYKVLDTHLGSGNSRIAAFNLQCYLDFKFYSTEIDPHYVKEHNRKFKEHCIAHGNVMFKPEPKEKIVPKLF